MIRAAPRKFQPLLFVKFQNMKKELFLEIANKAFSETKNNDFYDVLSKMETMYDLIWKKEFSDFSKKVKAKVKTLNKVKFYLNKEELIIQVRWKKKDTTSLPIFVDMITEHNKKEPVCKLQHTRNSDKSIYDIIIEPS